MTISTAHNVERILVDDVDPDETQTHRKCRPPRAGGDGLFWAEKSSAIEQESCEILAFLTCGSTSEALRLFRGTPEALLQEPVAKPPSTAALHGSGSYTLWLYYHG